MDRLVRNKGFWGVVIGALAWGAVLPLIDGRGFWLQGWTAYSLLLGLGAGSIFLMRRLTGSSSTAVKIAFFAFGARLLVGVLLALLMPVAGYHENESTQRGYVFDDANFRDYKSWTLASSQDPLSEAFSGKYPGDQYGGLMAVSAFVYRYLSPDAHRPWLILVLTATVAAWGVLFLWKASREWFGERVAGAAAWIFALYPESVLLGSSQMREAFITSGIAISFYALTEMRKKHLVWLAWLAVAAGLMFFFQPAISVFAMAVFIGAWYFDPGQRRSLRQLALMGAGLVLALAAVSFFWSRLPSLQGANPGNIALTWLMNNFNYQSWITERASGTFQKLLDDIGEWARLAIVLAYGSARPVLPAAIVDPAAWIWRVIGIFRSAGWYLLAPFLVYGVINSFRVSTQQRRAQLIWISSTTVLWILLAAMNSGADMWDGPRYRSTLLAWQALLAAWAYVWARDHRDAWLPRWLAVEGVFVLVFTEWYLSRYYPATFIHFDIYTTAAITLGLAVLILGGGWLWDRKKRRLEQAPEPVEIEG